MEFKAFGQNFSRVQYKLQGAKRPIEWRFYEKIVLKPTCYLRDDYTTNDRGSQEKVSHFKGRISNRY